MTLSAAVLALAGLGLTFAPAEVLARLTRATDTSLVLTLQVTGAFSCGFAMLNWMARGMTLGGIYGRPIIVANVTRWTIASLALLKATTAGRLAAPGVGLTLVCAAFAVAFARVMVKDPLV